MSYEGKRLGYVRRHYQMGYIQIVGPQGTACTCVSSSRGASGAELALAYSSASAMLPALPASTLPDDVRAAHHHIQQLLPHTTRSRAFHGKHGLS